MCISALNLTSGGGMRPLSLGGRASQERGFERVPVVLTCLMLRGGSATGAWVPPAFAGDGLPWMPQGDGGGGAGTEGAGDASGSMDEEEGEKIVADTPEEALGMLQVAASLLPLPLAECERAG